jgi:hypothetical protein
MMNAAYVRFFRSAYRREPIVSFMITIGAVDAIIGGVGDRVSLLTFGIGTVVLAIALRWLMVQRSPAEIPSESPQIYLPPTPSQSQLPNLNVTNKKRPPRS